VGAEIKKIISLILANFTNKALVKKTYVFWVAIHILGFLDERNEIERSNGHIRALNGPNIPLITTRMKCAKQNSYD
jgi:hypothetical protein